MKIARAPGFLGNFFNYIGFNMYEVDSIKDYLDNKDKIFSQRKFLWRYLVRERVGLDIRGQIFYQYKNKNNAQLSDQEGSILEVKVSNLTRSSLRDREELCRIGLLIKTQTLELHYMHQFIKNHRIFGRLINKSEE